MGFSSQDDESLLILKKITADKQTSIQSTVSKAKSKQKMNNKIGPKISIAVDLPITQIGFLAKRSLPTTPMYFDLKDKTESLLY